MIHQAFTTPIYQNAIEKHSEIQNEVGFAFEDLKNKGAFEPNSLSKCHMLSDNTFNSNLFDMYNMPTFKSELMFNTMAYVGSIDSTLVSPDNFYIDTSWIAWNRPGDYTHVHHHGFSDISGVYYFKTNGQDGDLSLQNPNHAAMASRLFTSWQERFMVRPKEGNLILFPGWLAHNVLKNETSDDRISVSFNILIKRG